MRLHLLTRRGLVILAPPVALVMLALAPPLWAANPAGADLTGGCRIQAISTGANGAELDRVAGPGSTSSSNPFVVDPKGTITWSGEAPLIRSGSYSVGVKVDLLLFSLTVPVQSGSFTNTDGKTSASFCASWSGGIPSFAASWFTVSAPSA